MCYKTPTIFCKVTWYESKRDTHISQAMVSAYPVGLAALLALDGVVVLLLDAVITLMGKGAPHLWLPGKVAASVSVQKNSSVKKENSRSPGRS